MEDKVKFQMRQRSPEELEAMDRVLKEKALKRKEKAEGILNDFSVGRNYSPTKSQYRDTSYINEYEVKTRLHERYKMEMEKRMQEQREHQENMSRLWNVLLPFVAIGVLFVFVLLIWFSLSILQPYLQ